MPLIFPYFLPGAITIQYIWGEIRVGSLPFFICFLGVTLVQPMLKETEADIQEQITEFCGFALHFFIQNMLNSELVLSSSIEYFTTFVFLWNALDTA